MPIDRFMNIQSEIMSRPWQLKFAWRPHRCCKSNKLIWLEWAYYGKSRYVINVPVLWMTTTEYLIKQLKGN